MDWNANDTNIIASSSIDGVISLFDLNSEKITSKVLAHIGSANKIAFGPEMRIASVGDDGCARLFDIRSMDQCLEIYKTKK